MAKVKTIGIGDYVDQMSTILKDSDVVVGKMVYEGAGIVADEVRRRIQQIPERHTYETATGKRQASGITDVERAGLSETLGITRMRSDNGFVNVRIGFDGYNDNVTDQYPKGHPNSMVARTIESGTSWLRATPFIAPAVSATKGSAEKAMEKIFDNGVKKK